MKLWNVATASFNKFVSQNGDYSGDLIFISLWSEKRPITLACIIFAEWNPILVSYSFWDADPKHSACFDWMSHFLTKCDALYSIFAFDHNLQVMYYSLTSRTMHTIPVFLWARLQLFLQFSAHFHLHEWFWKHYLTPNPDFYVIFMNSDRRKCKHDPDVFCFICGCFKSYTQTVTEMCRFYLFKKNKLYDLFLNF